MASSAFTVQRGIVRSSGFASGGSNESIELRAHWHATPAVVRPRPVIAWPRQRFRDHWRRLSQQGKPGRPAVAKEVRTLIRAMWQANPMWGSPRMVGERRKVGIEVTKSTAETYRVRPSKPPSPTWQACLTHHVRDLVALDYLIVPTVTRQVLCVLQIRAHRRASHGRSHVPRPD
jgi:hypothetical protein